MQHGEGKNMEYGKKVWIFPDMELPPKGENEIPGHESIIITNTGKKDAHIEITLFYVDQPPIKGIQITVGAERVRCLRTNDAVDFGEFTANQEEQYALMLKSDVPIVAQYGRAEPRRVAFYTTTGYACD